MKLSVNYRKVAYDLIPKIFKIDWFARLIFALIKPLSTLNNDVTTSVSYWNQSGKSLYQYAYFVRKFLSITGQTIYLEKFLNDNYDSTQRRIYIINTASNNITYTFNLAEARPPFYTYNTYKAATTYALDERVQYGLGVYKSLQNSNTGNTPNTSTSYWEFEAAPTYIFNQSEVSGGSTFDFLVYVPAGVLAASIWSEAKVRAEIDQYRMASTTYDFISI